MAASEAKFRNLVDSVVDVVFTTDAPGRFTYASAAAERMLGVKPDELIGRTFASLIEPADHAALGAVLHLARATPNRLNAITLRGGQSSETMRHIEVRFSAAGEPDVGGHLPFSGIVETDWP